MALSSTADPTGAETGVYYAPADLAGFWARFLVLAIDASVALAGAGIVYSASEALGIPPFVRGCAMVAVVWAYMAGLKTGLLY